MQALRVHTSNRLERLADALAAVVERPLSSPLAAETIVVRNTGMERWVTLALATRLGVWANARFPLPNAFFDELFRLCLGEEPSESWTPEVVAWRILKLLPGMLDREELAPLRTYLADGSERKRWQLAGRIADLFDQYMVYRPDWMEGWRQGGRGGPSHGAWQAVVLRGLWAEERGSDRAAVWRRLMEALRSGTPAAGFPERVSVFGIAALPPFYLEALGLLARSVEVNLFLLNPCRQHWSESIPDRRFLRLRRTGAPGQGELWEGLPSRTGNGLLASLGGLGGELFRFLLDLEPKQESEQFADVEGASLLARLQAAILDDLPPPPGGPEGIGAGDRSLQVHSCYGPMREIEALRDRLLALFDADPGLRPEDVLVMAPEIEVYVPYIEAVFGRGAEPRIPFNLSDRKLGRTSQLARTLLAVLHLPRLRFGAPDVLDILESEPVRLRLGLAEGDLARIRRWIVDSGIRWGIDGEDRARVGVPPRQENTWRFGLRRLLLGTALEGDRVFGGVLPQPAGGERETLEAFVDFAERLMATVASLEEPRSLSAWSRTLEAMLGDLFEEGEETRALVGEIARLATFEQRSGFTAPVSVDVIEALLAARLESSSPGLGFLTGGVTFCSLLPMRAVPFRVICLLGMGFGAFPRAAPPVGFDLMARDPRPGDRSRRDDDRYLFLETLVSARDVLYLSYVGRNAADGSEMAPSVVVSELLDDVAARFHLAEPITVQHPLHAHDRRYFDGSDPRLASYAAEALEAAGAAKGGEGRRPLFLNEGLPPLELEGAGLRLEDLEEFYRNPSRFLLRRRLEIVLSRRTLEIEAREPFAVGGLERYLMQNELLDRRLRGEPPEEARASILAGGRLPHGPAGRLDLLHMDGEVARFVDSYGERLRPASRETVAFDVTAGGVSLSGTLELWAGRLLRYRFAAAKPFDRLGLWIAHLAACRAGLTRGASELLASDGALTLPPLDDTGPLDDLVRRYLEGQCRPLPFFPESSLAFAEAILAGRDEGEATARARQKWDPRDAERGWGEAEEPSVRQLFGGVEPFGLLFREVAVEVYRPLLEGEVWQR